MSPSPSHQTEHTYEDIDQSGRHARHHRGPRPRQHLCCRCSQCLQELQGLHPELRLLPEVLRWQLHELLQVTDRFGSAGEVKKSLPPRAGSARICPVMNTDGDLSALLQGWQPGLKTESGFNRSVWSRIEARQTKEGAGLFPLFSWVERLAVPRFAAATLAVALFGGILIGGVQARSAQQDRYLQAQNPYMVQPSGR